MITSKIRLSGDTKSSHTTRERKKKGRKGGDPEPSYVAIFRETERKAKDEGYSR